MALPRVPRRTEEVPLHDGSSVTVRGLSRGEVLKLKPHMEAVSRDDETAEDIRGLETSVLSFALDEPIDEVSSWYDEVGPEVIEPVINAAMRLSGLTPGAARPTSEG